MSEILASRHVAQPRKAWTSVAATQQQLALFNVQSNQSKRHFSL